MLVCNNDNGDNVAQVFVLTNAVRYDVSGRVGC